MGGRKFFFIFLILTSLALASSSTNSDLSIDNSPPSQIKIIENYSWENGSLENIIDLDDYFKDWEGDNITYSVKENNTVSVKIDSENRLSFYTNETEISDEIIISITDGQYITISNTFSLFIGKDIISPNWINSYKNKTRVHTGDIVKFSTDWTDERNLSKYSLLIDQGLGWEYYTGSFSGREATSEVSVNILASVNETVYWKFCAEDTSQNSNCTDIYEFVIRKINTAENNTTTKENTYEPNDDHKSDVTSFEADIDALLLSLAQGISDTQIIKITNTGTTKIELTLTIQAIEDFVTLSDSSVNLDPGQSKEVLLEFNIPSNTTTEDYYGNLVITGIKKIIIPIVLNINRANPDYSIGIDLENTELNPGELVTANIIIKNYGDKIPLETDLYIAIKDYYGQVQNYSEQYISFESESILTRELQIPKDAPLGEYLFYVSMENEKGLALNSTSFNVGTNFRFQSLLKYSSLFILVFFVSIFSAVFFYRYRLKERRLKSINLYVKLLELQTLINEKKYDEATKMYIEIKKAYGEKVSKKDFEDKEKLEEAIEDLSKKVETEEVKKKVLNSKPVTQAPNQAKPQSTSTPTQTKAIQQSKPQTPQSPKQINPQPTKAPIKQKITQVKQQTTTPKITQSTPIKPKQQPANSASNVPITAPNSSIAQQPKDSNIQQSQLKTTPSLKDKPTLKPTPIAKQAPTPVQSSQKKVSNNTPPVQKPKVQTTSTQESQPNLNPNSPQPSQQNPQQPAILTNKEVKPKVPENVKK